MKKTLKKLNELIDDLILSGQMNSKEYKRLCRLHYQLTH